MVASIHRERQGLTMLHTITGSQGLSATITTVGAACVSLEVPGRDGKPVDVVLGLACEDDYRDNPNFIGATVGRCVNRIGGAQFSLGGIEYPLTANDGANCNHSGRDFWAMRAWELAEADGEHATLSLHSPAGDQGFPGEADVTATYRVDGMVLEVTYAATVSEPTIVNMTNHVYFNLTGHDSGSAMGHLLRIDSDRRLVSDETVLPTGAIADVAGTAWDFRELRPIERAMPSSGFDTCYVLSDDGGLAHAARLVGEKSGIAMDLFCDQPGMQLYTANFMSDSRGKHGTGYQPRSAVCLEPGIYPDAIHHPDWPSPVFSPERPYLWRMRLEFSLV